MQESPRRRTRRTPPKGGSLPFLPIIIGVVVLGFVIGAGLSVVGKHGSQSVALATSTPEAEQTIEPVTPAPAATTAAPQATPTAPSTPARTASPKVATPVPVRSPFTTTPASATPAPQPTATRGSIAHILATPAPVAIATRARETATPEAVDTPAATPQPTPEPAATELVTPSPVPAPAIAPVQADSAFARLAGSVVRQYLVALANGDKESAYAALGQSPGSQPGALPEAGVLDSSMRIARIEAHGSDSAATVDVELTTSNGPYSGQYTLHKSSTGAAIIVSHTFGKP